MKIQSRISVCALLLFAMVLSGCIVISTGGCSGRETYERTVELSQPMAAGMLLNVSTTNGSIIVQGQEAPTCTVIATVTGRAQTKERARELAEQTQVELAAEGDRLRTIITPPKKNRKESICVGFNVTLPHAASLGAITTNGNIQAVSLTGDMTAQTTNGNIKFNQIRANQIKASTTNGSITCDDVTGSLNLGTINGSVHVSYGAEADVVANADINTVNGSISVALPKNASAKVAIDTVNGRIKTDIPIIVSGQIAKNSLHGTIGTGEGNLSLHTVNGSIDIH